VIGVCSHAESVIAAQQAPLQRKLKSARQARQNLAQAVKL
jgi:hypothetical protein